jgi:hypothetical protein
MNSDIKKLKEYEEKEEEEKNSVGPSPEDVLKTKFISINKRGANNTGAVGEIKVYDELGKQVSIIKGSEKIIGVGGPIIGKNQVQMGIFAYDDVPGSYSHFAQEQDIDYQSMVWELEKPTSVSKVYIYRRAECADQEWCKDRTDHMNIILHGKSDGTAPMGDPTHIYTLRKHIFHKNNAVDKTIPIEDFTPIDVSGDRFCVGIPRNELYTNIYGRLGVDYNKCVETLGQDRTNKMFAELSELKKVFNEGKLPLFGGASDAKGAGYKYAFRGIGNKEPANKAVCWAGVFLSKELDAATLSQYIDKKFCQYKSPLINYPTGRYFDNECPDITALPDHPLETDTFVVTDLTK